MQWGDVLRSWVRGAVALLAAVLAALTLVACTPPGGPPPTLTAVGSAEQVYATGLAPNAQASLLNQQGATVSTQHADSLGGVLFRNVAPGDGYRVRLDPSGPASAPLTVHTTAAAPWDPGIYNQSIPNNGY